MFLIMSLGLVDTNDESSGNQTPAVSTDTPYATGEPFQNPDKTSMDEGQAQNLVFDFLSNYINTIIEGQCHTTYALLPLYYHLGCAFFLLAFASSTHVMITHSL